MTLSQLSAPLSKDQAYALVDAVSERDDLSVTASAHENEETGEWVFEATCLEEPSLDAFAELARDRFGQAALQAGHLARELRVAFPPFSTPARSCCRQSCSAAV